MITGAGADQEPLHAAVPDHEPKEPRLPCDRGQHGQRGLQHELHEFVADVAERFARTTLQKQSGRI